MKNLDYSAASDKSLLEQIGEGDQGAATEVFARHSPRLLAMAKTRLSKILSARVDPDDIIQSTFKSFFRRAGNGGYLAPESGDLFNLLIVIAMRKVNAKADYHQAASRDVRTTRSAEEYAYQTTNDESKLRELCLTIEDVCQEFSEVQRHIISLRLEGFSVAEISEKSQRSKRTVERELQQFRQKLSRYFEP